MAKIKKAQFLVARKEMEDDIVEYTWNIPVGCGQFDRIKIHRVIRERISGIPERCNIGLMMLHGDFSDFSSIFMQSGMAAFLADHGIDVWGADRRWTAVTSEALGDGSFMCDWNTAKYLQDLRIALNFARTVRLITGSGRGRMFLCGHSSGANLCYACANEETKAIEPSRNVKGLVAIDTVHKFDPVETQLIQDAEARYNALCAMREDGKCISDDALTLKTLAVLAKTDPEGTSPVIPPLNNEQAAICVSSNLCHILTANNANRPSLSL